MGTENQVPGYGGVSETESTNVAQSPLGVGIAESVEPAAPVTPPSSRLMTLGIG